MREDAFAAVCGVCDGDGHLMCEKKGNAFDVTRFEEWCVAQFSKRGQPNNPVIALNAQRDLAPRHHASGTTFVLLSGPSSASTSRQGSGKA
jgi:hypothetical protein